MTDADKDEFFGEDESDGLRESDLRAQEHQFHNMGYLQAFDESKDELLQNGFEVGYSQAFGVSMRLGEMLAEAALNGNNQIVTRIQNFLREMKNGGGKSEQDIRNLEAELQGKLTIAREDGKK